MDNVAKRETGLDALRILLALMVVAIHFNAPATGNVSHNVEWMPMKILVYGMGALCIPAVNVYVIMSGYFSFSHSRSSAQIVSSLIKLWLCLIFFSLLGLLFGLILLQKNPSFNIVVSHLFPISSGEWWYMTNYFLLILISPMINRTIKNNSLTENFSCLILMIIFFSVVPIFLKFNDFIGLNSGYGIIWFFTLYYTGALLKEYGESYIRQRRTIIMLLGYLILSILLVLFELVSNRIIYLHDYSIASYNSVVVYFQAILLFLIFKKMKILSNNKRTIICKLGSLSMATYVFHCQSDFSSFLWSYSNPSSYANSVLLIPLFFGIALSVYCISITIESLRRKLFNLCAIEKNVIKYLYLIYNRYIG